ncbi:Endonuclease/exonuclease/phosphatase [Macleaya cordata]|uniref:Endonuclease/exonuclease/phosphatase n=1 Tax=Macleaya cordata TaxID=56857 RepID=A0A200Q5Q0_MACCD|nr:Endonuclease/exonuclease/phosphatase [Macleaya cordata]
MSVPSRPLAEAEAFVWLGRLCFTSFIYGEPNRSLRSTFWYDLTNQQFPRSNPWIILGDFNCLLCPDDKLGGRAWRDSDATDLNHFTTSWNLIDPGFTDPHFTWSNKKQGEDLVLERLERAFFNQECARMFPDSRIDHLPRISSDHSLIFVSCNPNDCNLPRPFQFLTAWTSDPSCKDVI